MERHAYPSDLSDAEFACLEPHLAGPKRRGRPRVHPRAPATFRPGQVRLEAGELGVRQIARIRMAFHAPPPAQPGPRIPTPVLVDRPPGPGRAEPGLLAVAGHPRPP